MLIDLDEMTTFITIVAKEVPGNVDDVGHHPKKVGDGIKRFRQQLS